MVITETAFAQAVETYGIYVAENARDEAVSAYNCNARAGFSRATCEAESAAIWQAFLDAAETHK